MKVDKIAIENFKGISSFELSSKGRSFELHGANGAGKSSVLEAIVLLLTGRMQDVKPLIRDQSRPTTLTLETNNGKSFQVEIKKGKRIVKAYVNGKPVDAAKEIDGLFSENQLDPSKLLTCPRREQLERFAKLVGIDITNDLLERRELLDKLATARAAEKGAEEVVNLLGDAETPPKAPDAPEGDAAIQQKIVDAKVKLEGLKKQNDEAAGLTAKESRLKSEIASTEARLTEMEKFLADVEKSLAAVTVSVEDVIKAENEVEELTKAAAGNTEAKKAYDDALKAIADIKNRNKQRGEVKQKLIDAITAREGAWDAANKHYTELLARVLPKDGDWSYDEEQGISYKGREIGVLSTGESMEAAIRYIGNMSKQSLRCIFIANSNLLDIEKRKNISALAAEQGLQVIWEVVDENKKLAATILTDEDEKKDSAE